MSVSQQDEKSQHKNKAKGMKILRARLYELERSRIDQERSQDRKNKTEQVTDLKELELIIFHKGELQIIESILLYIN